MFYSIWLYSRERIEIFHNVWSHRIFDPACPNIEVRYTGTKNPGSLSVSTRYIGNVYDIRLCHDPDYMPEGNSLSKVVRHGQTSHLVKYLSQAEFELEDIV